MPTLPIYNATGKESETFDLPENIFGGRVNQDLIHQAVVMYHASQRQGNASTKERGSVAGSGKKPWKQKGTGRARAGSVRSPLWHKGGVVFGPHPRDFSYSIPKKIKLGALRETLNAKYQEKDLYCLDVLNVKIEKTKEFAKILKNLDLLNGKVLALLDKGDEKLVKVSRNIPRLSLMRVEDVNAFDVLRNKKILISKAAFQKLIERLK